MPAVDDPVLLISGGEAPQSGLRQLLRALYPTETHALAPPRPVPQRPASAVVLDGISLGGEQSIRAIQAALRPFLARKVPVLCILDAPNARDHMQALEIGVSAVLPTGSSARTLATELQRLIGAPPDRAGTAAAEVPCAIREVGFVIADLMAAAATGAEVDVGLTAKASGLLLQTARAEGLDRWMRTVSTIHDQTYRHCLLMAGLVAAFVVSLGFNAADCARVTGAAILHDVGKAWLPAAILDKPGPLTAAEHAVMRTHVEIGYRLLLKQGDHHPTTLDVVRHHHEYLDGSGYPLGLRGREIRDEVRIATLCDLFAALIERRAYKPALSSSQALDLMAPMTAQLDQDLLDRFRRLFVRSA